MALKIADKGGAHLDYIMLPWIYPAPTQNLKRLKAPYKMRVQGFCHCPFTTSLECIGEENGSVHSTLQPHLHPCINL